MSTRPADLDGNQATADFDSGDPVRVERAMESVRDAWANRVYVPLPLPSPDCLRAFGPDVPTAILQRFLTVVQNYPAFEVGPAELSVLHTIVEVLLRYGRDELIFEVSLAIRASRSPEYYATDALKYIESRGLDSPLEALAAQRLVDDLLDSEKTRWSVVRVLGDWAWTDVFPAIVDSVLDRLTKDERRRIDEAREG